MENITNIENVLGILFVVFILLAAKFGLFKKLGFKTRNNKINSKKSSQSKVITFNTSPPPKRESVTEAYISNLKYDHEHHNHHCMDDYTFTCVIRFEKDNKTIAKFSVKRWFRDKIRFISDFSSEYSKSSGCFNGHCTIKNLLDEGMSVSKELELKILRYTEHKMKKFHNDNEKRSREERIEREERLNKERDAPSQKILDLIDD